MISLPLKPKLVEKKANKAIFRIDALYPGYGVTIGNSLRRVLLSSLSGAAITQIKIKGVQHEFSTIHGILEDVVSIILNLKQLRFRIHTDEPQKIYLSVKGTKEIKGADFKLPAQLELINQDAHVATITDKSAQLEMEAQVERGLGYEPVERRKKEKLEVGVIPIDAIFTPVRRVSYRVENMRVGEKTDFDKLFLEIETDGTLTPEQVFSDASAILIQHFSLLIEKKKPEFSAEKKEDLTQAKLEDLKISPKIFNILLENDIKTVNEILRKTEDDLLSLKRMGKKGLKEIKKALKKLKLELKS